LEAHWLYYIPAMDMFWAIQPLSKPLQWSAEINPEKGANLLSHLAADAWAWSQKKRL
jgi:hypothetical protein